MGVSINTRKAYSEIDEFLGLLSDEQRNKIPQKLREFFKEEKDTTYIKGINPEVPIKNQDLKEETLGIIALLNLQYWCEDEAEKQRLKNVYSKNEEIYQEMLQEKFNPNDIFKKKDIITEEKEETQCLQMVEYKEPLFKRISKGISNIKKSFVSFGEHTKGVVHLGDSKYEITVYTSCCNTVKGIFYYTTYENPQICAVDMHKENLDGNSLISYPMIKNQHINIQN
jgi:transcriptional regulator with PAS, ATPase and Fis domain